MKPVRFIILLLAFLAGFTCRAEVPEIRAAYLDFRTQVMTLQAMKDFAAESAENGLNAIVVEWEASFPFEDNLILRNRYSFSREDVAEFIGWCSELGIEVIPLQNCFGHSEYILRHPRYASLREDRKDCSQVCPVKYMEAEKVFESIFAEIAAMHPSEYIHIGCDETRLLGHCRECRKIVENDGISALYMEYVSRMCSIVTALGKTPIIWADIVLKHPEAIGKLPANVVIADWNYGWKPDYFGKMENILVSGHEVWGACSLRSHPDNLYLVQWRKHLKNIFDYTSYAASHGFGGIINTSWSTSGTYGYIYDDANEVVDIQPVREVYPQNGFDMLFHAYYAAVSGQFTDPDAFLDSYCRDRLGIVGDSCVEAVKAYFNMHQTPVSSSATIEMVENELSECLTVKEKFQKVKFPRKSKDIAAHLSLMLDIRINYLEYKIIDVRSQMLRSDAGEVENLSDELRSVLSGCEKLRKRFVSLNGDYLKDAGQSFNTWTYYGKMKNLAVVLSNIVKH